jgi:hypothetical protein
MCRGTIERSSPLLRSWLFQETRAHPKKIDGAAEAKREPRDLPGGPEVLPRHKEMTRPVTSTLKAVPGRATTVVSCPTERM